MTTQMNLLERVERTRLTPTEKLIIENITTHITEFAFYNGAQMAKKCDVSPSLVTRLIQKLGYNGFLDFKRDVEDLYKQSLTPYDTYQEYLSKTSPSEKHHAYYSIRQDLKNINSMQALVEQSDLDQIVKAIKHSNKVYLAAMFASENPARLLSHYLDRLEINYRLLFGLGLSKKNEYYQPKNGDVLIAFSSQGILREIFEAAKFARSNGATIVAITDSKTNPLARNSDYVLVAPVNGAIFDYSHVATVAMINLLANSLASTYDPKYLAKRLEEVLIRWNEKQLFVTKRSF